MSLKNFVGEWVSAPWFQQTVSRGSTFLRGKLVGSKPSVPPFSDSEPTKLNPSGRNPASLEQLLTTSFGRIVWVEADKIALWGRALTWEQNQHVRYFKDGIDSYRRFFELHQPRNQFEFLMLDQNRVGEFSLPRPPEHRRPWSLEVDDGGAGLPDDVFANLGHGPISEQKLLSEAKRLRSIRESVERDGFRKLDDDFITFGEIIVNDDRSVGEDYRVLLVNGVHRTSVLAHLGWPLIPMMAREIPLREVRLSALARWPGVLDGTFSEEAALTYFLAHFRDPTEELLPGW